MTNAKYNSLLLQSNFYKNCCSFIDKLRNRTSLYCRLRNIRNRSLFAKLKILGAKRTCTAKYQNFVAVKRANNCRRMSNRPTLSRRVVLQNASTFEILFGSVQCMIYSINCSTLYNITRPRDRGDALRCEMLRRSRRAVRADVH